MSQEPPQLNLPPTREMSEPAKPLSPIIPWWVALLFAICTGGGHALVTASELGDSDGGIGYRIGSLIGALLVAPAVAAIVALVARPLRNFTGFLTVYAAVSMLALLGALER